MKYFLPILLAAIIFIGQSIELRIRISALEEWRRDLQDRPREELIMRNGTFEQTSLPTASGAVKLPSTADLVSLTNKTVTAESFPKYGDWVRVKDEGYDWYGPVMFVSRDKHGCWFRYSEFEGGNPWLSQTANPKIEKAEAPPNAQRKYMEHLMTCKQCQDHAQDPCKEGSKLSRDVFYPANAIISGNSNKLTK